MTRTQWAAATKRWAPFALWLMFVAGVIGCADAGAMQAFFRSVQAVPGGDKAGHFFLIGVLTLLLNRGVSGRSVAIGRWRVQAGGLCVAVVMTLEELSQIWTPTRRFSLSDLAANYAGILVAGWLTRRHSRSRAG